MQESCGQLAERRQDTEIDILQVRRVPEQPVVEGRQVRVILEPEVRQAFQTLQQPVLQHRQPARLRVSGDDESLQAAQPGEQPGRKPCGRCVLKINVQRLETRQPVEIPPLQAACRKAGPDRIGQFRDAGEVAGRDVPAVIHRGQRAQDGVAHPGGAAAHVGRTQTVGRVDPRPGRRRLHGALQRRRSAQSVFDRHLELDPMPCVGLLECICPTRRALYWYFPHESRGRSLPLQRRACVRVEPRQRMCPVVELGQLDLLLPRHSGDHSEPPVRHLRSRAVAIGVGYAIGAAPAGPAARAGAREHVGDQGEPLVQRVEVAHRVGGFLPVCARELPRARGSDGRTARGRSVGRRRRQADIGDGVVGQVDGRRSHGPRPKIGAACGAASHTEAAGSVV